MSLDLVSEHSQRQKVTDTVWPAQDSSVGLHKPDASVMSGAVNIFYEAGKAVLAALDRHARAADPATLGRAPAPRQGIFGPRRRAEPSPS